LGELPAHGSSPRSQDEAKTARRQADELSRPCGRSSAGHQVLSQLPCAGGVLAPATAMRPSGALHGIMRVRASPMTTPYLLHHESDHRRYHRFCKLLMESYRDLGFEDVRVKLPPRPRQPHRQRRHLGYGRLSLKRRPRRPPRISPQSGEARFTVPSSNSCCATPSPATGMRHGFRSTSTPPTPRRLYIAEDGAKHAR